MGFRSAGGERWASQRVNGHHAQPPRSMRISSLHLFSPSASKSTSLLTQPGSRSRKEAYSETSMIWSRGSPSRPTSNSFASGQLSPAVWGEVGGWHVLPLHDVDVEMQQDGGRGRNRVQRLARSLAWA